MKPGTKADLTVWRKGARKDITVTVGELKDTQTAANDSSPADQGRLGVAVRPLTPEEQQQADTKGGLLVLDAAGPAARAGIQQGDLILAVNGKAIDSVDQLKSAVGKSGKHIAVLVQRQDARIFVPIELG